jgi:hypothetical protein
MESRGWGEEWAERVGRRREWGSATVTGVHREGKMEGGGERKKGREGENPSEKDGEGRDYDRVGESHHLRIPNLSESARELKPRGGE